MELARELHHHGAELRLVSRTPRMVNGSDTLAPAELLDAALATAAVKGSRTVHFTAGLPPDTALWEAQFPAMLKNARAAARVE